MNYDLEERTARFSEDFILFTRSLPNDERFISIIKQGIRSVTSIGANYCETNHASSKRDFENKISICRKEANETKYWLRIIAKTYPEKKEECRKLWKEAHELTLIFSKIYKSSKNKKTI
jgi:four helix bundle protein